jgi:ceramide glucosyltransferase
VLLPLLLGALAILSLALGLWQFLAGMRFPLHRRETDTSFAPALSILKPLKGCDAHTEDCLRSWLEQDYAGSVEFLFGAASESDPVCDIVRRLLADHPNAKARLVICGKRLGANGKVSTLAQLEPLAAHEMICVSDADVRVPAGFLPQLVAPLRDPATGLAHCFYRLGDAGTLAARWEALMVNADFWSQVSQAASLKPVDFALGAAMCLRRERLAALDGFASLADFLADDFQLGHRLAQSGSRVAFCPVPVDCLGTPQRFREVWAHQFRWARTLRACRPVAYFFSLLGNGTLWPLLWVATQPQWPVLAAASLALGFRGSTAFLLERRLTGRGNYDAWWLAPAKDVLQTALWVLAFLRNTVTWRGEFFRVQRDGKLVKTAD